MDSYSICNDTSIGLMVLHSCCTVHALGCNTRLIVTMTHTASSHVVVVLSAIQSVVESRVVDASTCEALLHAVVVCDAPCCLVTHETDCCLCYALTIVPHMVLTVCVRLHRVRIPFVVLCRSSVPQYNRVTTTVYRVSRAHRQTVQYEYNWIVGAL